MSSLGIAFEGLETGVVVHRRRLLKSWYRSQNIRRSSTLDDVTSEIETDGMTTQSPVGMDQEGSKKLDPDWEYKIC